MPEHPEIRAFAERLANEAEYTTFVSVRTSDACVCKNTPPLRLEISQGQGQVAGFEIKSTARGKQIRLDLKPVRHPIHRPASGSIFKRVEKQVFELDTPYESYSNSKCVVPHTRESMDLLVTLTLPTSIVIGLGLAGYVHTFLTAEEAFRANAHLVFEATDAVLAICSSSLETMYWKVGDFDLLRSPDPVMEYHAFVGKIVAKLFYIQLGLDREPILTSKTPFSQPICRLLMSQTLFNGVGNYLRAEIMHRLLIHPFTPSIYVFRDLLHWVHSVVKRDASIFTTNPQNRWIAFASAHIEEIESKCPLIPMVRRLCEEAYAILGDQSLFSKWLLCYKKATNCVLDSGGREVWFFEKLITDPSKGTNTNAVDTTVMLSSLTEPSIKKIAVEKMVDSNAQDIMLSSAVDETENETTDFLSYTKEYSERTSTIASNLPIDVRNRSSLLGRDAMARRASSTTLHDAGLFQSSFQPDNYAAP